MKYLKLCCVAPHPPIMIPDVGGHEVKKVEASTIALERLADEIESIDPESLVVMSPHTPINAESFTVKTSPQLSGSFGMFGAPQVRVQSGPDLVLADAIVEKARDRCVTVLKMGAGASRDSGELDHGILVPLYYLARRSYPLVCLSMSLLDYRDHYQLGIALREAIEATGRTAVLIASGDLSHRLKPGAPAGYSPRGVEFDRAIVEILDEADYVRLFKLDPVMVEEAGECGLRSIFTLAGAVDGYAVESKALSYEGPFGVGYMVARVKPGEPEVKRSLVSL